MVRKVYFWSLLMCASICGAMGQCQFLCNACVFETKFLGMCAVFFVCEMMSPEYSLDWLSLEYLHINSLGFH